MGGGGGGGGRQVSLLSPLNTCTCSIAPFKNSSLHKQATQCRFLGPFKRCCRLTDASSWGTVSSRSLNHIFVTEFIVFYSHVGKDVYVLIFC